MSDLFQGLAEELFPMILDGNLYLPHNAQSLMKAPPASVEAVQNLPVITIYEKGKECIICLKEFEVGSEAIRMPCKHIYHKECIVHWLSKTNSCPLCRYELPTDDDVYEEYMKMKKREELRQEMLKELHNSMFT